MDPELDFAAFLIAIILVLLDAFNVVNSEKVHLYLVGLAFFILPFLADAAAAM